MVTAFHHKFLASETAITLPIPIFIPSELAAPIITRPLIGSIRKLERGTIWIFGRSGFGRRDDQHQRQGTVDIHRLGRVGLVQMPDLEVISILDLSLQVVLGVAFWDLVVRDVDTTLALGVGGRVAGFLPVHFSGFGRVVDAFSTVKRELQDLVDMAAVFHRFQFDGVEDAVRCGILIIIQHQVSDAFGLLRIRLGEVFLELSECVVVPCVLSSFCEVCGIAVGDMGQAMVDSVFLRFFNVIVGGKTGEVHCLIFLRCCNLLPTVVQGWEGWFCGKG